MEQLSLLNLALKNSFANNEFLADDLGQPSVMVRIPKFKISDVIEGGKDMPHPAFVVKGREIPEIYVSKYPNLLSQGRGYSLPAETATAEITFEQARAACEAKGLGWHMITNAEYAALALWSRKNGTMPYGNNCFGKDYREPVASALPATSEDGRIATVKTGSGPASWYHNGSPDGVWGLNGNLAEWVGGLRILDGEIQIIADNDAAARADQSAQSSAWRALLADGTLVAPGSCAETLKFDYQGGRWTLSTSIKSQNEEMRSCLFEETAVQPGLQVPELLKALSIFPADAGDHGKNRFYSMNQGLRMAARGSHWNRLSDCGAFALYVCRGLDFVHNAIGFRSVYIAPEYLD